jgi:hypothetical protein
MPFAFIEKISVSVVDGTLPSMLRAAQKTILPLDPGKAALAGLDPQLEPA